MNTTALNSKTTTAAALKTDRQVRDLILCDAVVEASVDALMTEAVELRPDLAHLANHHLFVADALVPLRQHVGALGEDAQHPPGKEGHRGGVEHLAQFDDVAGANQSRRFQHLFGFQQVCGAARIPCTGVSDKTSGCGARPGT